MLAYLNTCTNLMCYNYFKSGNYETPAPLKAIVDEKNIDFSQRWLYSIYYVCLESENVKEQARQFVSLTSQITSMTQAKIMS